MPDTKPADAASPDFDNEAAPERQARIRPEAMLIAEAEAEIDAGYWLDEAERDAWLKAVTLDPDALLPAACLSTRPLPQAAKDAPHGPSECQPAARQAQR